MKRLLAYILAMCVVFAAFSRLPADSVKVYFRLGHSQFDPSLRDNCEAMARFISEVCDAVSTDNIDRIVVRAYSSPDGASNVNANLSKKRCNNIADYIADNTGVNRNVIQELPEGVAWNELRNLVAETPEVPYREKILYILDNTPLWIFDAHGKIIDGRKKQLMDLAGGRPFKWLCANLFPELRNAVAVAVFLKSDKTQSTQISDKTEPIETSDIIDRMQSATDTIIPEIILSVKNTSELIKPTECPDSSNFSSPSVTNIISDSIVSPKNRYFALKTNMLYDSALIPNIGFELYAGKNISVYGEWMYAWWDSNSHHRYWRIYGGELGARWWFGRKAKGKTLTGHHLGIYGGAFIFDFEWGGNGYMGGKPGGTLWDRCLVNAGIEYGYSLPIGRRLNLDFSLGVGYLAGKYIKYFPFNNDYYTEKEYKLRFFGPTKAEISLVWLLGRGNFNNRKGGVE